MRKILETQCRLCNKVLETNRDQPPQEADESFGTFTEFLNKLLHYVEELIHGGAPSFRGSSTITSP